MREMNASEFKAKCLAILDEVAQTGERIKILKHGKPVAELGPTTRARYPQDDLIGSGEILGDIISPAVDPLDWDANRGELA